MKHYLSCDLKSVILTDCQTPYHKVNITFYGIMLVSYFFTILKIWFMSDQLS